VLQAGKVTLIIPLDRRKFLGVKDMVATVLAWPITSLELTIVGVPTITSGVRLLIDP